VSSTVSAPVVRHLLYEGRRVTSAEPELWHLARRRGVTATDCAKIVRKNGAPSSQRRTLLAQKLYGLRGPDYAVYAHGREREPHIAAWVAAEFGIEHNEALCVGEDNRHMATPDAVGPEGIAEFKTATQPLERAVRTYSDQLQWQMHVLHTERVLFVVEDRHTLQREWTWVHRDEGRIRVLVEHADRFIAELEERKAQRQAQYAEA